MSDKLGTVELAPRDNPYLGGSGGYGREKPYSEMKKTRPEALFTPS
jgi:cell division protease FtsH